MTAVDITAAEYARNLTDRIKVAVEGTWHLIAEAYTSGAWTSLGYGSWDDYCLREFGNARLKLPHEERMGTVRSLRQSGLSLRAIESATGISRPTVIKDLREQVVNSLPPEPVGHVDVETGEFTGPDAFAQKIADELAASDGAYAESAVTSKIVGIDGKSYSASTPKAAEPIRRPDLSQSVRPLSVDLFRIVNRLQKLRGDDRLGRNKDQVAALMCNHLSDAIEVCQDLLDAISNRKEA